MSIASDFAIQFGKLIERYIDSAGLSRKEVAFRVWQDGDRAGHVTGYVNGKRGKVGAPLIRKFADALSIPDTEIEALRTREREAAQAEAKALNIPIGFLDAMADLFGDSESFGGWDAYAEFMAAKAQDYTRLQSELEELKTQQPNTANRIPEIEALLGEGQIEQAESALEALRDTATDKALEGLRDLSRIMSLQAEAALLRQDADAAFALWRDAAALFDALAPMEGAERRYANSIRLRDHALRMGGNGFQHSAALLSRNLDICTQQDHPQEWANNQIVLGRALQEQGNRTQGEAGDELLCRAVDAYTAALQVYTRQNHPTNWAITQNNLGIALAQQGLRTEGEAGAALLFRAVAAFTAALEVRTRQDHPVDWAMTHNNLGLALEEQGTRTEGEAGADLLSRAVAAYTAALEVRTRQDHPVNWAGTQNNLGNALMEQGIRTEGEAGADLLSRAVAAFTAALEVRTRQDHPVWWAETQECFAHVYCNMAERAAGDARAAQLAKALTAVENALEIYNPETMSYRHGIATRLREGILAMMQGE